MKKKTISLIIPCYNEQDNILLMYQRVKKVFTSLSQYDYEIIYIDNSSTDDSEDLFEKLAKKDKKVKVIFMSRNFGSPQPGFIAGLKVANGDAAVLIHGDIQDPPEIIKKFTPHWEKGYDVVYGIIKKRKGFGTIMSFLYEAFYFLLNKLSYISIPRNSSEFSLLSRPVITNLLKIQEYDYNLRCLRAFVGFKQIGVPYVREERKQGRSQETIFTAFGWAKTFILNFSFKPLAWITKLSIILITLSVCLTITLILSRTENMIIFGLYVFILFVGAVELLAIGVIGEYLAKIFLEVKKRPRYIIRRTLNVSNV